MLKTNKINLFNYGFACYASFMTRRLHDFSVDVVAFCVACERKRKNNVASSHANEGINNKKKNIETMHSTRRNSHDKRNIAFCVRIY